MSSYATIISVIGVILITLISMPLALSSVHAEEDEDPSPNSSTASSSGGYLIPVLIIICSFGVIIGLWGLFEKKEKKKWFYAIMVIVSLLCAYLVYEVFYTWTLTM